MIIFDYASEKGVVRPNNEDVAWSGKNESNNFLAILCDGLGGYKGGSNASDIVLETFKKTFLKVNFDHFSKSEIDEWVTEIIKESRHNISLFLEKNKSQNMLSMATTMVCGIIIKNKVYIYNVGDSRCYYIERGKSKQITIDQNLFNFFKRTNALEEKYIKYKSDLYSLLQFIGIKSARAVNSESFITELQKNSYLVLTSDGVHNFTNINIIEDIIYKNNKNKLSESCSNIISNALANSSNDNLSIVIIGDRYE